MEPSLEEVAIVMFTCIYELHEEPRGNHGDYSMLPSTRNP
jgi:hypothetical protein